MSETNEADRSADSIVECDPVKPRKTITLADVIAMKNQLMDGNQRRWIPLEEWVKIKESPNLMDIARESR